MTTEITGGAGLDPAQDEPRKFWLPTDWQDESIPPPRETPDAWIVQAADGAPMLAGVYEGPLGESTDPARHEDAPWGSPRVLTDGETVHFNFTRAWGTATLTVRADGTWSVDREMPGEANCVRLEWVTESVSQTVADLVKYSDLHADQGDQVIEYYEWSDDIPFVFDATTRRFLPKALEA
jgi:hypothetical protein